jgi:hypothetical protein
MEEIVGILKDMNPPCFFAAAAFGMMIFSYRILQISYGISCIEVLEENIFFESFSFFKLLSFSCVAFKRSIEKLSVF